MRGRFWFAGFATAHVFAAAALLLAASPFSSPAHAQTACVGGAGAATGCTTSNIQLTIPVTASVGGVCNFATAPNATLNFGDLDAGAVTFQEVPFELNCNVPARVGIVAANGAFTTVGAAPSGYLNAAPYTVSLTMAGAGATTATGGPCTSSSLTSTSGSPCGFRGPATTSQGLRLNAASIGVTGSKVRVDYTPPGAGVLIAAASYADTLTVTVSAAP